MKLNHPIYEAPLGRIILVVVAILATLCAGPAYAASEPGTITIVVNEEPEDADPVNISRKVLARFLMKNILEPLTDVDPDSGSITPGLATSWKQIDANTWHFFLRKGVKFHDGKDFNAEAVLFSINRIYNTKLTSSTRGKFFSHFKMDGKALDSYTLQIKTDKVEPLMPILMGTLPICSPNSPMDKLTRQPIGTGPYKFVKWDAGTQIILERFDGYWGKQPQVKKAVYVWRGESSVRAAMVAIGEADLALSIAAQDANRPDMDSSYFNSETSLIRIGAWEPPLNDIRVRMALNYAVDRDAIRGTILPKDVVRATQIIGPTVFGHNPDLKGFPYDPQRAKKLVDEARKDGVPVDKEISIVSHAAHYPGCGELYEALVTMFRAVGLNAKLRLFEVGVLRKYQWKPYPTDVGVYLWGGQHDNTTDATFSVFFFACQGRASGICDEKLDDLIEKAQVATGNERKTLWRAAFKRMTEDIVPFVTLFHMVEYSRVGKRINFKPNISLNSELQLAKITFK